MEPRLIALDGQNIAVYDNQHKGPAVVMVHGNSTSARCFAHQFDSPLTQRWRLIALDLPGHGNSDVAGDPSHYSLPGYADVLSRVCTELGATDALLVGWSLGGHVALEALFAMPRVAGVMVFGTPPLGVPPDLGNAYHPNPAMQAAFSPALTAPQIDGFVRAFFRPGTCAPHPAWAADVARTDGNARLGLILSVQAGRYQDEVSVVRAMGQPLAIVQGREEQLVNPAYLESLPAPTLWRRSVQYIDHAGHAPHWEQPQRFNALLDTFARDCHI